MSSKKKLTLIKDARFPSELRGVTKTTAYNYKRVKGAVGKYHVKLYELRSHVSRLDAIIPNFESPTDAAKVFAGYFEMQSELHILYQNATMACPKVKEVAWEDVKKNVAAIDNEIVAQEKKLARLKCKKQAEQALLVFKESFASSSKALKVVSERYTFA